MQNNVLQQKLFSPTFLIIAIFGGMADKVSLQVTVSAKRVAVVGAELEVGGEKRAGVVASASEKKRGASFMDRCFLGHIFHIIPTIANASSHKSTTGRPPRRESRGKWQADFLLHIKEAYATSSIHWA